MHQPSVMATPHLAQPSNDPIQGKLIAKWIHSKSNFRKESFRKIHNKLEKFNGDMEKIHSIFFSLKSLRTIQVFLRIFNSLFVYDSSCQ